MTAKEFFFLVAEMRRAQSDYFKTKDLATFRCARYLENAVDNEIKRAKEILKESPQLLG